jgi:hypothetical protein
VVKPIGGHDYYYGTVEDMIRSDHL